ncbi:MAG: diadenylate cyclase CdaA [Firmicutes bacterium]|jgi:diadenylate cyclase|nr:diadenylate cyclase CdaA [Bacillota bacterium]
MAIFYNIRLIDILDIVIVAYVIYKLLMLIKETRAEQLIKGLLILVLISKLSEWAKLYMLNYLLKNTLTLGVVALLIVFQPELRRALEYIGRSKLLKKSIVEILDEERLQNIDEIVNAVASLSRQKIGALIVMERETGLNEIIETGIDINGNVSSGLLINVFIPNTPLHDGAVVIRKNKIMAAGCFLPLSENKNLSKELGTRHRAALGMVEHSDALVIIVSEETGAMSVAMNGRLSRFLDSNSLKNIIKNAFISKENKIISRKWWNRNVNR